MRSDMHKVICEEPRHGGGREKHSRRGNLAEEFLPRFESVRRPHKDRKSFGEHLGPLRRWLRSQVGRPWDKVYSEACAVIKPDSVVRNHIKFHLLEFVQRHTFMRDGRVWCFSNGWDKRELLVEEAASHWSPFYVHPVSGLLLEAALRARVRWRDKAADHRANTQRWLNDGLLLRQLRGIWFACAMDRFPAQLARGDNPWRFDLAERRLINCSEARDIYGKEVHCIAKRQLSRRELRQRGLANSVNDSLYEPPS